MSRKHNMSHNVCSVYDYSTLRWKVQPGDMVSFYDREGGNYIGQVYQLSRDIMYVMRLKDRRSFAISLYDIRDWHVRTVDTVRQLPNGIFKQGDRVCLDGELNFPDEEYIIEKFDHRRVKVHYFYKGRSIGCYYVREGEILKYLEVK